MRTFRAYAELPGQGTAEVLEQVLDQRERLAKRLLGVRHVVAIASGKGGVGKSAVTANLAATLATAGHAVGAVDGDLNGPSLPRMLGASRDPLRVTEDGVIPATGAAGVRIVSLDLLLQAADTPLRWRGPSSDASLWRGALELGAMRELIADVAWPRLDYLLIDLPPGTDRIERFLELVPSPAAVLLVTTPAAAAVSIVARSARLLVEADVGPIGVVVNMHGFVCPCCGSAARLFSDGDLQGLTSHERVETWAEIPFEPRLASDTDGGDPIVLTAPESLAGRALTRLAGRLQEVCPP